MILKRGSQIPPPPVRRLPPPDIRKEHAVETYKALTTTGIEAVKTALLLNGGAAVAFITFLGNLLSKQDPAQPHSLPNLKSALFCYFVGVVAAGFALAIGYLLNLRVYNEVIQQWPERHRWWMWPAIALAIGSYLAFITGSILASVALGATI